MPWGIGWMGLRFTVLASGSGGNAALVETDAFGVLIDIGLGPRQLEDRFREVGRSWSAVNAVLLTHTHSDHWKDRTLAYLQERRIPFYCHRQHHETLAKYAPAYDGLLAADLVRFFEPEREMSLALNLRCRCLPIRHDGGATFAFRFQECADLFGQGLALGYATDLGTWDENLANALCDVDLLALEFNHDEHLERSSGRMPHLIARVLGDEGHLSNIQAARLVHSVLTRSTAGRLRYLVQLHLSRDCNDPELARTAAQLILQQHAPEVELHTAEQDRALPTLELHSAAYRRRRNAGSRRRRGLRVVQPWLPGLEPEAYSGDD